MAQARPRFCPQCGTPTTAGQGFCANCGRVLIAAPSEVDTVPQGQPRQRFSQTGPQTVQQSPQPVWARPSASFPRSPKKRMAGRTGCVLLFLVLLVVAGIGTYAGAGLLGLHLPGFSSAGSSGVQPPIETMAVNATVTYAGVLFFRPSNPRALSMIPIRLPRVWCACICRSRIKHQLA